MHSGSCKQTKIFLPVTHAVRRGAKRIFRKLLFFFDMAYETKSNSFGYVIVSCDKLLRRADTLNGLFLHQFRIYKVEFFIQFGYWFLNCLIKVRIEFFFGFNIIDCFGNSDVCNFFHTFFSYIPRSTQNNQNGIV